MALYEFYQNRPYFLIKAVSTACAKNMDRFPSPRQFGEILANVEGNVNQRVTKKDCSKCDGYGWVMFEKTAFRGRCEHGKQLSEKIAWAPETLKDEFNWKNKIQKEIEELYGKNT